MKILQVADVPHWAIGHLTNIVKRHNPHLNFRQLFIHPKEVEYHVEEMRRNMDWPDVIEFEYWRTASQLLTAIPELKDKKLILTHHNQKDLLSFDWKDIDHHIVHTQYAANVLIDAGYENVSIIPYGFDLDYFQYREDEPKELSVGYCGRIVPWKGLKEIARACFELGYPIKLMGKMDKPSYWAEIPEEHQNIIDFGYMEVPDDARHEFYNDITIYVGNSGPNHEEGTMPLQEAMACGVPVVTTPSGVAADILDNYENALIVDFGDDDQLKEQIKTLMEDRELRERLRRNAWQTIKLHTEEAMAWEFEKVFHKTLHPETDLVSVILPTYNSVDNVLQILDALTEDEYPSFEVVVADDGSNDNTIEAVDIWRQKHPNMIVKMVSVPQFTGGSDKPYGLAKARNMAVVEACGKYLMFCDSRMQPEKTAMTNFVMEIQKHKDDKLWLFGDKGGQKQTFVENFSMIRRDYFIRAGMMCERIETYGGLSQELRARFNWQGFSCRYLGDAKAKQLTGSHLTGKRRADIVKAKLLLYKLGIK